MQSGALRGGGGGCPPASRRRSRSRRPRRPAVDNPRPPNTRSDHKRLPVVWNRSLPRNLDLTDLTVALTYDIVDFASDIALEAANGFELRVALADPPVNRRVWAGVGSRAADDNNVQGAVGRTIPAAIQAMPGDLSRRCRHGTDSAQGGKSRLRL